MPRFPFRSRPGDDLRALFAHDRIAAQARDLGYSSISPGEGAAEVLDAGGNTVAAFGHLGGASGLLLLRGGAWVTVQAWVQAELAAGTESLASRMTAAEGRLDSHASRIGAAEGDIADHETRLNAHVGRIGRLENNLELVDGKLVNAYNSLEARVAELEEPGKIGNPIDPTPIQKG